MIVELAIPLALKSTKVANVENVLGVGKSKMAFHPDN
jgi:hypothetical protein